MGDLLRHALNGKLRLPGFQREFKWNAKDVRELFDSIARGYPIGTLLFWESEDSQTELSFGPVRIQAQRNTQAWLILDGQQRLTSLIGVLLGPKESPTGDVPSDGMRYDLCYDLTKAEFFFPGEGNRAAADTLPVRLLGDTEELLDWQSARHNEPDQRRRNQAANQLAKAIREYKIPVYIVRTQEERIAREVFNRLNTTGKRLTVEEVFKALHRGEGGAAHGDLDALGAELRPLGFGDLGNELLLKVIVGLAGGDLTKVREAIQDRGRGNSIPEVFSAAPKAARQAVRFLQEEAEVPHVQLLPYKLPLVLLARLFHAHGAPGELGQAMLRAWIWRSATSGHLAGNIPRQTQAAVAAIRRARSADEAAEALLAQSPPLGVFAATRWDFRTAGAKVVAGVLAARNLGELPSGELLDPIALLQDQGAEAFKQVIRSSALLSELPHDLARGPGNRVLYPEEPGQSIYQHLLDFAGDPDLLDGHFISPEALACLKARDAGGFLRLRQAALMEEVQRTLVRRCGEFAGTANRP